MNEPMIRLDGSTRRFAATPIQTVAPNAETATGQTATARAPLRLRPANA